MRISLIEQISLVIVCLLGLSITCSAEEGGSIEFKEIGLEVPADIAGFEAGKRFDYEGDLGYSVGFKKPKVIVTIYVYDKGLEGIGTGVDAPLVKEELENAGRDIKTLEAGGKIRGVTNVELTEDELKEYTSKFLMSAWGFEVPSGPARSFAFIRGQNGKFLKIRATLFNDDDTFDVDSLKAFVKELEAAIK